MSDERIIHGADLSRLESIIFALSKTVAGVEHQLELVEQGVEHVDQQVGGIDAQIARLSAEFGEFVRKDIQAKAHQLAQTRVIEVRQELETKFGHYAEVRRATTGILQATDIAIVREDTITTVTEELTLKADRYWLAPCLLALSAWIADDLEKAGRALQAGLQRDSEKTSLLFALICRRINRLKASGEWLAYYLAGQDPTALDRQTVVLIEGIAAGVFGPESRAKCWAAIDGWLKILSERVGFVEEQEEQWHKALLSMQIPVNPHEYKYLSRFSPTWTNLEQAMTVAQLYAVLFDYFTRIFAGEIIPSVNVTVAVDDLLEKLVTSFDDEELPLQREQHLLNLIIEERGDDVAAQNRANNQQEVLSENLSFTQLLTNAAMHPETSHASRSTQRYAIAVSCDWVLAAFNDIVAQNRSRVPASIALSIEGWQGATTDGTNETELVADLEAQLQQREQAAMDQVKLSTMEWIALVLGAGFLLLAVTGQGVFLGMLGVAGLAWFFVARNGLEQKRIKVREEHAQLKESCTQALRACLAEVVDWRREYEQKDQVSEKVVHTLKDLSPEQHMLTSFDSGRSVLSR